MRAFSRSSVVLKTVLVLLGLVALSGVFGLLDHRETRTKDAATFAKRLAAAAASPTAGSATSAPAGGEGGPPEDRAAPSSPTFRCGRPWP